MPAHENDDDNGDKDDADAGDKDDEDEAMIMTVVMI